MTREIVNQVSLPVTVKTRLGWDDDTIKIVEVALRLQDTGIKALTIHGRTRQQMYKGSANWNYIKEVKDHPDIEIPICTYTNTPMTFYFQIAFPDDHIWSGLSLAVFAATNFEEQGHYIPESLG